MKFFPAVFSSLANGKLSGRRNLRQLLKLVVIVLLFVALSSVVFHVLMEREGRGEVYQWFDGIYWTMVTMTTLGYGEITFHSGLGKLFSICVMLFGMMSMLVILPFAFIRFAYEPWMEAQNVART
ncbi:MAG: potassium channel family protein, partial [Verrucomicrobiota bacterium]|nr:potassium channel family protein [Verrucomicrobiota bacterium]